MKMHSSDGYIPVHFTVHFPPLLYNTRSANSNAYTTATNTDTSHIQYIHIAHSFSATG